MIVKFKRERNVQHGIVVGISNDLGFNGYQIVGRHVLEEAAPAGELECKIAECDWNLVVTGCMSNHPLCMMPSRQKTLYTFR